MDAIQEHLGELLAARRSIEAFPNLRLVQDICWSEAEKRWSMCIEVALPSEQAKDLPQHTRWWVTVDAAYPWGDIDAFPAVEGGTDKTFWHQFRNDPPGVPSVPWRRGKVCFRFPNSVFVRAAYVAEPLGHPDRLRWVFSRLNEWVRRAATGTLVTPGDPFELPDFSPTPPTVAFSESVDSLKAWQVAKELCGIAQMCRLGPDHPFVVREFQTLRRTAIVRPTWGTMVSSSQAEPEAAWLRLPELPILPPYQAPRTWGDLRVAATKCLGRRLEGLLAAALNSLRDGSQRICLLGFPLPRAFGIGEPPALMHWQAVLLPPLAYGLGYRKGFRANAQGYWKQDRYKEFRDDNTIQWLKSYNWHEDQLASRGRLAPAMTGLNVAILGGGAVGSILAELLVRGGVKHLLLVDPDRTEAGNLVRHTLGLWAVGMPKAAALAEHLNSVSVHASAAGVEAWFPGGMPASAAAKIQECQCVIDCTGSDEVLRALGSWTWPESTLLASLSLGFGAERSYVLAGRRGDDFLGAITTAFGPELEQDRTSLANARLPAEALGCWHPLFPARVDRIWAMVAVAVGHIERWVASGRPEPTAILLRWHEGQIAVERR